MTIAKVIIESDDPGPVLVESLVIRIFSTVGDLITSGTTDVLGEANFDIPDADYDLYFFKQGVSINAGMPLRITIDVADPDTPPNTFKVIVHVASLPEAVDPLRCRISGEIIGADGAPTKDGRITVTPTLQTGVIGGNVVSPQHSASFAPDENGHYEFDLLRKVNYRVFFHFLSDLLGVEPPELDDSRVPDLPAINVANFMFPLPIDAAFDSNTLALVAGGDEDDSISTTITYSDGSIRTAPTHHAVVASASSDESVAIVALQVGKILVTPLSAGVTNITITRTISSDIYYDPAPAMVTETLVVTVS